MANVSQHSHVAIELPSQLLLLSEAYIICFIVILQNSIFIVPIFDRKACTRFGRLCVISLFLFQKLNNYSRIWQLFARIAGGPPGGKPRLGLSLNKGRRHLRYHGNGEEKDGQWPASHPVCCFKIQLCDYPSPVAFEHYMRTDAILLLPQAEQQFGPNVKKQQKSFTTKLKIERLPSGFLLV